MGTIFFHAACVSMNITFSSCAQSLLYLPFLNAPPINEERQIFTHSSGQIFALPQVPMERPADPPLGIPRPQQIPMHHLRGGSCHS